MKPYRLAKKIIDEQDITAFIDWLKGNKEIMLTKGSLTIEFEKQWADWIGTKYAVFCNSGSSANLLMAYAAKLAGNLRNNKVIVPSIGWVTTVAPFIQFGFEPIMCGADRNHFGHDLDHLEVLIKEHDPAIVIMVQVLGVPGDMDRLLELKEKYDFMLLEDACAALGASYDNKKLGTFGDMSSFSFYFGHQLSTIEGGMVNTDIKEFYDMIMMLRSHGWGKDLDEGTRKGLMEKHTIDDFHQPFTFFVPGFNLRATDINAFFGLRMMQKADNVTRVRIDNHITYTRLLEHVSFQKWHEKATPCSISLGAIADTTDHRKRIITALDEHNIETRVFSAGNLGLHPFWVQAYGEFHHAMSDKVHSCGFFLPNHESMTEKDVEYICGVVNSIKT